MTPSKKRRLKERVQCRKYCLRYLRHIKHPLLSTTPSPSGDAVMSAVIQHLRTNVQGVVTPSFIVRCAAAIHKSEPTWTRTNNLLSQSGQKPFTPKRDRTPVATESPIVEMPRRFAGREKHYAAWVNTKAFLFSPEWKKLRYEVLAIFGRRCMCCGSTSKICVDHIKPRKYYPHLALDINNLQILCFDCNEGKGNWDETDWRTRSAFVLTGTC